MYNEVIHIMKQTSDPKYRIPMKLSVYLTKRVYVHKALESTTVTTKVYTAFVYFDFLIDIG